MRDEVRDDRIHGIVPAEHETGSGQNDNVHEHNDFADRKACDLVDQDRDSVGSIQCTAITDDESGADADHQTAKYCGEYWLISCWHIGVEQRRQQRQHDNAERRKQRELGAEFTVPQRDKRYIEYDEEQTKRQMRQVRRDD